LKNLTEKTAPNPHRIYVYNWLYKCNQTYKQTHSFYSISSFPQLREIFFSKQTLFLATKNQLKNFDKLIIDSDSSPRKPLVQLYKWPLISLVEVKSTVLLLWKYSKLWLRAFSVGIVLHLITAGLVLIKHGFIM
jgi:hypothetical protein